MSSHLIDINSLLSVFSDKCWVPTWRALPKEKKAPNSQKHFVLFPISLYIAAGIHIACNKIKMCCGGYICSVELLLNNIIFECSCRVDLLRVWSRFDPQALSLHIWDRLRQRWTVSSPVFVCTLPTVNILAHSFISYQTVLLKLQVRAQYGFVHAPSSVSRINIFHGITNSGIFCER